MGADYGEDYWTITLIDIRKYTNGNRNEIIGENVLYFNGCNAIIDTGTYLIYGPTDKIRCEDKYTLPTLGFVFKGFVVNGKDDVFELRLSTDDYVLEFENNGMTNCIIGLNNDSDYNTWRLGQVFLKAYYTGFDRETEAIRFVRSNPQSGVLVSKEDDKDNNVYSSFLK